jgi:hypothetical protein
MNLEEAQEKIRRLELSLSQSNLKHCSICDTWKEHGKQCCNDDTFKCSKCNKSFCKSCPTSCSDKNECYMCHIENCQECWGTKLYKYLPWYVKKQIWLVLLSFHRQKNLLYIPPKYVKQMIFRYVLINHYKNTQDSNGMGWTIAYCSAGTSSPVTVTNNYVWQAQDNRLINVNIDDPAYIGHCPLCGLYIGLKD